MPKTDPRVDAYIANAAEFAQPILRHLRQVVHATCPEVEETIKWRMPTFMYHGMLCGIAAFKRHCALGFWKGELIVPTGKLDNEQAMGQFGRITKLSELPAKKELVGYIRQAMKLNKDGVRIPSQAKRDKPRPAPATPADLAAALNKNSRAKATFDAFSPSCKREYVEWIVDARREGTRGKRVAQAVEWMAEGRKRNWKYENC